ncbi:MAG: Unknown protein [uncultured Sulfurovum sp.]|uniref:Uncharacterized protein n=1 Tax=uncultured Sulfurovum sp. TaxID=269237 RepID=A0A6S6U5I2_9BACT|nr:MAG: Unknown protein [uncultured Sulfurovum sp.]
MYRLNSKKIENKLLTRGNNMSISRWENEGLTRAQGKWIGEWMNLYLYLEQHDQQIVGRFKSSQLVGSFVAENVLRGEWTHGPTGLRNQFEIIFSSDYNYIIGGFWDRKSGYAYSREKNIKGYRDGYSPNH